jgi:hypothetical protein
MDYKSLTMLSLRLTGVFIMVTVVTAVPNTFLSLYSWANGAVGIALLLIATMAGFPILVGLFLIYYPGTIANRVVSGGAEPAGALQLQQVAFSVLGLYFATHALIEGVYWVALLPSLTINVLDYARFASTAAMFVAGVLLLFGGRGLANFIHRLRDGVQELRQWPKLD